MALTSTLFTGLSGLDVNQTRLNVVGNNIANVNTTAFKASRALFKPQFYVTDSAGGPASQTFGGSNPSQRGLGAQMASIEKNFENGALEPTGKPTDMAIDGNGFFIVDGKARQYTRDGSFTLNERNQLVTSNGGFVQGFGVDANDNVIAGALQNVDIPLGTLTRARQTETASFEGNLNANGAVASAASIINSERLTTAGGAAPTAATPLTALRRADATGAPVGGPIFTGGETVAFGGRRGGRELSPLTFGVGGGSTVQDLNAFLQQGFAIDPTVPPNGQTPGAVVSAIPGDPAGVARLVITGNQGTENALSLAGAGFTISGGTSITFSDEGTDAAGRSGSAVGESVNTNVQAYDSLGSPVTLDMTLVLQEKTATGTTWRFYANSPQDTDAAVFDPATSAPGTRLGTGTVRFDSEGKMVGADDATIEVHREGTGANSPLPVRLDFSTMTALTSARSSLFGSQDGMEIGTLSSFSVAPDGTITGSFDNGLSGTLGQVAVATFDNPQGLLDDGGNMFRVGTNSGVAKVSGPLELTAGSLRAGALELSNVDLSNEFINLIVASTGFSAASRVITTSDRLMTELLQTTR